MINPLYQELIDVFPFEPTHEQMVAMNRLATFVSDPAGRKVFLLKGYAGTGKTLIISTLVQTLARHHKRVVLMAPTGRAAKVFSNTSGFPAPLLLHFERETDGYAPETDRLRYRRNAAAAR